MKDFYPEEKGKITARGKRDIMFVLNYLIIVNMNI